MADAAFHLALLFLGGVVVAVLRQVAHLASDLDLAGDVDASDRRQLVEFGLEPIEGGLGKLVLGLAQGGRAYRSP